MAREARDGSFSLQLYVNRMRKYIHTQTKQTVPTAPRTNHVFPLPLPLIPSKRPFDPTNLVRFDSSRADDCSSKGFSASSEEAKWVAFLRSWVDICAEGTNKKAGETCTVSSSLLEEKKNLV